MRLPTLIYDADTNPNHLILSAKTFIEKNAAELHRFKLILYMYRPSHETITRVKEMFLPYTPYLTAGSKPPCIPCIWARHKTRYGIVIPSTFISIHPLWPYIKELRQTISDIPDLSYIRLTPDHTTTTTPKVYHRHTRHIYLTRGIPLSHTYPVLTKAKPPDTLTIISGALKPLVFIEHEEPT